MILDLFAGPGGWSEGVRALGLSEVGIEWDADACLTRAAAGHRTVRADVSRYPPEPFVGRVDGLLASPPCQAWSMAGKGAGRSEIARVHAAVEACREGWTEPDGGWEDERTPLILEPLRWAWVIRPKWIACEQVPPALPVWEYMADVLRSWGYDATAVRLLAADYGVPQTRLRAFLLAHRDGVRVPEPTHAEHPEPSLFGPARKPWVTMAEALGWEPGSRAWDPRQTERAGAIPTPDTKPSRTICGTKLAKGVDVWRLIGNNSVAGEGRAERNGDEPALTVGSRADLWVLRRPRGKGAVERHGKKKDYRRLDKPSLCVDGAMHKRFEWAVIRPATTVQADPRIGRPGHKDRSSGGESMFAEESLKVELHEAAILQGFPPDYPYQGSKRSRFEQNGNAVPPPVAKAIIQSLANRRQP